MKFLRGQSISCWSTRAVRTAAAQRNLWFPCGDHVTYWCRDEPTSSQKTAKTMTEFFDHEQ